MKLDNPGQFSINVKPIVDSGTPTMENPFAVIASNIYLIAYQYFTINSLAPEAAFNFLYVYRVNNDRYRAY